MIGIDIAKLEDLREGTVLGLEGLQLFGAGVASRRHLGDVLNQAVGLRREQATPRLFGHLEVEKEGYAVHRRPERPLRYLDLGCGVGSVLLMIGHKLRPSVAHGVEAQSGSVAMARRAISELPANDCVFRVDHGDMRNVEFDDVPY